MMTNRVFGNAKMNRASVHNTSLSVSRLLAALSVLMLIAVTMCGCGKDRVEADKFYVYDINREYTRLIPSEYTFANDYSTESDYVYHCVEELINRMIAGPDEPDAVGAIGSLVGDISYYIEGSVVTIDFGEDYYNMDITGRVLRLSAVVRTLCQLDGVRGVTFTVNNEHVCDSTGQPIGVVTADMILENDEAKINAYEKANLHLFFANAEGTGLVEVVEPAVYISNISMERLVVDYLIKGPSKSDSGAVTTINPDTKIMNVTVKDGICYVNLSSDFLTKPANISDEVAVYSIVNSLTRLSNESKVQLMIDGETEVSLGNIYLSTPFMSNYKLVDRTTSK